MLIVNVSDNGEKVAAIFIIGQPTESLKTSFRIWMMKVTSASGRFFIFCCFSSYFLQWENVLWRVREFIHILCFTYEICHYLHVIVSSWFVLIVHFANSSSITTEREKMTELNHYCVPEFWTHGSKYVKIFTNIELLIYGNYCWLTSQVFFPDKASQKMGLTFCTAVGFT